MRESTYALLALRLVTHKAAEAILKENDPVTPMKQTPLDIRLHSKSRLLEVKFEDEVFMLPCEYLRVYSPSAEVQGHGPGQEVLQTGKEDVNIVAIEPVGHYAVRLIFSDSHNSGIYSWDHLYHLGHHRQALWQDYLDRLSKADVSRDAQPNDKYLGPTEPQ